MSFPLFLRLRVLAACTLVLSLLAALPASADLDNFLCYKANAKRDLTANLSDVYDTGNVSSKGTKLWCAPASISGSSVDDSSTFLAGAKIKGDHVKQTGVVLTTSGTYSYDTSKADFLMLPAGMSQSPAAPPTQPDTTVDHYRCLKTKISKGTTPFPTGTVLAVQDVMGLHSIEVGKPAHLCVPTDKNGEGVNDPSAWLVCNKVKSTPSFQPDGIQTIDQFGPQIFDSGKEAELCRPASLGAACPGAFKFSVIDRGDGSSSQTRIQTGWNGFNHYRDVAGGASFTVGASCSNPTEPCGSCTVDSAVAPDGSAKGGRCTANPLIACDTIHGADADDCMGGQCEYYLFPPLPENTGGGLPLCTLRTLRQAPSGSIDNEAGSASIAFSTMLRGYIGPSHDEPCPVCVGDPTPNDGTRGGTCSDGAQSGGACDANGIDETFGAVSLDCLPSSMSNITGIGSRSDFVLTTGASSLPEPFACDAPYAAFNCPCPIGACVDSSNAGCSTNADCATCSVNADCGAGAVCDGANCQCSSGASVSRRQNGCSDSTCTDGGGGLGFCAAGPSDGFCDGYLRADGDPVLGCTSNADCDANEFAGGFCNGGGLDCGTCALSIKRPCLVEPISATGAADPDTPTLVSAYCMAPTSGGAFNNGHGGLPGPERVLLETMLTRLP